MKARVDYFSASGTQHDNCAYLAQRYDPDKGFRRLEGESIVVATCPSSTSGSTINVIVQTSTGWYVQLWRSASGNTFVAESFGEVLQAHRPEAQVGGITRWTETELDAGLDGLWGFSDELVFTWGNRQGVPVMFLFNGQRWDEIKAPSFGVSNLHGLSRDTIWACGKGGRVAQWTGTSWQELVIPTGEDLINIHVVQEKELYAVGVMGNVYEGSPWGWAQIGSIPGALQGDVQAVAKFAGELWVGAGRLGLWKRKEKTNEYECLKPNIAAVSLDTRGKEMVIGGHTFIAWTLDGKAFKTTGIDVVANQRGESDFGDF